MLHLDADDIRDGLALRKHLGEKDGRRTVEVGDITCANPAGGPSPHCTTGL